MSYTFALPSNKRMEEDALKYLASAGLTMTRHGRDLKGTCLQYPEIVPVFIDYKDVAVFVGRGDIDFGITTNVAVAEKESAAVTVRELDFSRCRLAFAAKASVQDIRAWEGKRVAARHPHLAAAFFAKVGRLDIEIIAVSGSTEVYPALGIADGIEDIVDSGASLRENNLVEVATIKPVHAVLVQKPGLPSSAVARFLK